MMGGELVGTNRNDSRYTITNVGEMTIIVYSAFHSSSANASSYYLMYNGVHLTSNLQLVVNVTKRTLAITLTKSNDTATKVYDGNSGYITMTVANWVAETSGDYEDDLNDLVIVNASTGTTTREQVASTYTYTYSVPYKNVGLYYIGVNGLYDNSNYQYTVNGNTPTGSDSEIFEITPKTLTVEWSLSDNVTTNTVDFTETYSANEWRLSYAFSGYVAGETLSVSETGNFTTHNVGSYNATLVLSDNGSYLAANYSCSMLSCDWAITPKTLTGIEYWTIDGLQVTGTPAVVGTTSTLSGWHEEYTGAIRTVAVTLTGLIGNDDPGIVQVGTWREANVNVEAGEVVAYTASFSAISNTNYEWAPVAGDPTQYVLTWTIDRRAITYEWMLADTIATSSEVVYRGSDYDVTLSVGHVVNGHTLTFYRDTSAANQALTADLVFDTEDANATEYVFEMTARNAGTYVYAFDDTTPWIVTIPDGEGGTIDVSDNYTLTASTATLIIDKKEVTVEWAWRSAQYVCDTCGTGYTTLPTGGDCTEDGCDGTVTDDFSVVNSIANVDYNRLLQRYMSATLLGVYNNEIGFSAAVNNEALSSANPHSATVSISGQSILTVSYTSNVTAYKGDATTVLDGGATIIIQGSAAGVYKLSFAACDAFANYVITAATELQFTINKVQGGSGGEMDVVWVVENANMDLASLDDLPVIDGVPYVTYDSETFTVTAVLMDGETPDMSVSFEYRTNDVAGSTKRDAGVYTTRVSSVIYGSEGGASSSEDSFRNNYEVTNMDASLSVDWRIKQKTVTHYEWSLLNNAGDAGNDEYYVYYDGAEHEMAITSSDFIAGDDVYFDLVDGTPAQIAANVSAASNAGDYTRYVTGVEGTDSANYEYSIGTLTQAWSIRRRVLTLRMTDVSFEYNGTYQVGLVMNLVGLQGEDTLPLTITVGNDPSVTDYASHAVAVTEGSLEYTFNAIESTLNFAGKDAKTYTVTTNRETALTGALASNYEWEDGSAVSGSFTISKRTLVTSWVSATDDVADAVDKGSSYSVVYDKQAHGFIITWSGVAEADIANGIIPEASVACAGATISTEIVGSVRYMYVSAVDVNYQEGAVPYVVMLTMLDDNYQFDNDEDSFTIRQKQLTGVDWSMTNVNADEATLSDNGFFFETGYDGLLWTVSAALRNNSGVEMGDLVNIVYRTDSPYVRQSTNAVASEACVGATITTYVCNTCHHVYRTRPDNGACVQDECSGTVVTQLQCGLCGYIFESADSTNVYYYNALAWGEVYAYAWTGENHNNEWPGTKMSAVTGHAGWYVLSVSNDYEYIIFNCGEGGEGKQTADLVIERSIGRYCFYNEDNEENYWGVCPWADSCEQTGFYVACIEGVDNYNYVLADDVQLYQAWRINKRSVNVIWGGGVDGWTIVYDASTHNINAYFDLVGQDITLNNNNVRYSVFSVAGGFDFTPYEPIIEYVEAAEGAYVFMLVPEVYSATNIQHEGKARFDLVGDVYEQDENGTYVFVYKPVSYDAENADHAELQRYDFVGVDSVLNAGVYQFGGNITAGDGISGNTALAASLARNYIINWNIDAVEGVDIDLEHGTVDAEFTITRRSVAVEWTIKDGDGNTLVNNEYCGKLLYASPTLVLLTAAENALISTATEAQVLKADPAHTVTYAGSYVLDLTIDNYFIQNNYMISGEESTADIEKASIDDYIRFDFSDEDAVANGFTITYYCADCQEDYDVMPDGGLCPTCSSQVVKTYNNVYQYGTKYYMFVELEGGSGIGYYASKNPSGVANADPYATRFEAYDPAMHGAWLGAGYGNATEYGYRLFVLTDSVYVAATEEECASDANKYVSTLDIPYQFVAQNPLDGLIHVVYTNGTLSYSALVDGNNGIVNAGRQRITATVDETDNYKSWTKTLYFYIERGRVDAYLNENTFNYNGQEQRWYLQETNSVESDRYTLLPDGSALTASYVYDWTPYDASAILVDGYSTHFDMDIIALRHAGTYQVAALVEASNYSNYDLHITYVSSYVSDSGPYVYDSTTRSFVAYDAELHEGMTRYVLVTSSGAGAKATYTVTPAQATVNWTKPDSFTYNGFNQADSVRARILTSGEDAQNVQLITVYYNDDDQYAYNGGLNNYVGYYDRTYELATAAQIAARENLYYLGAEGLYHAATEAILNASGVIYHYGSGYNPASSEDLSEENWANNYYLKDGNYYALTFSEYISNRKDMYYRTVGTPMQGEFRLAGTYQVSAVFDTGSINIYDDAAQLYGNNEFLPYLPNNYVLSNQINELFINKASINVSWYYDANKETENGFKSQWYTSYDSEFETAYWAYSQTGVYFDATNAPNGLSYDAEYPFLYDGFTHSVYAIAYGILQNGSQTIYDYPLATRDSRVYFDYLSNFGVYYGGVTAGSDAGDYQSSITGFSGYCYSFEDYVAVNATFAYNYDSNANSTLAWRIDRRLVSEDMFFATGTQNTSALQKYYNGTPRFDLKAGDEGLTTEYYLADFSGRIKSGASTNGRYLLLDAYDEDVHGAIVLDNLSTDYGYRLYVNDGGNYVYATVSQVVAGTDLYVYRMGAYVAYDSSLHGAIPSCMYTKAVGYLTSLGYMLYYNAACTIPATAQQIESGTNLYVVGPEGECLYDATVHGDKPTYMPSYYLLYVRDGEYYQVASLDLIDAGYTLYVATDVCDTIDAGGDRLGKVQIQNIDAHVIVNVTINMNIDAEYDNESTLLSFVLHSGVAKDFGGGTSGDELSGDTTSVSSFVSKIRNLAQNGAIYAEHADTRTGNKADIDFGDFNANNYTFSVEHMGNTETESILLSVDISIMPVPVKVNIEATKVYDGHDFNHSIETVGDIDTQELIRQFNITMSVQDMRMRNGEPVGELRSIANCIQDWHLAAQRNEDLYYYPDNLVLTANDTVYYGAIRKSELDDFVTLGVVLNVNAPTMDNQDLIYVVEEVGYLYNAIAHGETGLITTTSGLPLYYSDGWTYVRASASEVWQGEDLAVELGDYVEYDFQDHGSFAEYSDYTEYGFFLYVSVEINNEYVYRRATLEEIADNSVTKYVREYVAYDASIHGGRRFTEDSSALVTTLTGVDTYVYDENSNTYSRATVQDYLDGEDIYVLEPTVYKLHNAVDFGVWRGEGYGNYTSDGFKLYVFVDGAYIPATEAQCKAAYNKEEDALALYVATYNAYDLSLLVEGVNNFHIQINTSTNAVGDYSVDYIEYNEELDGSRRLHADTSAGYNLYYKIGTEYYQAVAGSVEASDLPSMWVKVGNDYVAYSRDVHGEVLYSDYTYYLNRVYPKTIANFELYTDSALSEPVNESSTVNTNALWVKIGSDAVAYDRAVHGALRFVRADKLYYAEHVYDVATNGQINNRRCVYYSETQIAGSYVVASYEQIKAGKNLFYSADGVFFHPISANELAAANIRLYYYNGVAYVEISAAQLASRTTTYYYKSGNEYVLATEEQVAAGSNLYYATYAPATAEQISNARDGLLTLYYMMQTEANTEQLDLGEYLYARTYVSANATHLALRTLYTHTMNVSIPTSAQIAEGNHLFKLGGELTATFEIKDMCAGEHQNYLVVVSPTSYIKISPRNLYAIFDNSVQTYTNDTLDRLTIDYLYDGYNGRDAMTQDELLTLLTNDNIWDSVNGKVIANVFNIGTIGEVDHNKQGKYEIPVSIKSENTNYGNYTVNDALLLLVGAKVISSVTAHQYDFRFEISTLEDFASVSADSEFLREVRESEGIGNIPSYYQTADITGIDSMGNHVIHTIEAFSGKYYGYYFDEHDNKVYTKIDGVTIAGKDSEQYVGLFASLQPGAVVEGVRLVNTIVYSNVIGARVGGIAGYAVAATVKDCSFDGTIIAGLNAYVGGIIGELCGGSVENCTTTGKLRGGELVGSVVGTNTSNLITRSRIEMSDNVIDGATVYTTYAASEYTILNVEGNTESISKTIYTGVLLDTIEVLNESRINRYLNIGGTETVTLSVLTDEGWVIESNLLIDVHGDSAMLYSWMDGSYVQLNAEQLRSELLTDRTDPFYVGLEPFVLVREFFIGNAGDTRALTYQQISTAFNENNLYYYHDGQYHLVEGLDRLYVSEDKKTYTPATSQEIEEGVNLYYMEGSAVEAPIVFNEMETDAVQPFTLRDNSGFMTSDYRLVETDKMLATTASDNKLFCMIDNIYVAAHTYDLTLSGVTHSIAEWASRLWYSADGTYANGHVATLDEVLKGRNLFFLVYENEESLSGPSLSMTFADMQEVIALRRSLYYKQTSSVPVIGKVNDIQADVTTIYFYNDRDWDQVYAYAWFGEEEYAVSNAAYPGVAMQPVEGKEGWYYLNIATNFVKVIFDNGGTGEDNQTADIALESQLGNFYYDGDWHRAYPTGRTTYYYYNADGWDQVYAYAWTGEGADEVENTSWPGARMTKVPGMPGWYYVAVDTRLTKIIFNNGGSGEGNQTGDITVSQATGRYYHDSAWHETVDADQVVLYYHNTNGWSAVYAYAWKGTGSDKVENAAWHGIKMTALPGHSGWYYVLVDADMENIIFNNGSTAQTSDIAISLDDGVYYDGAWTTRPWAEGTIVPDVAIGHIIENNFGIAVDSEDTITIQDKYATYKLYSSAFDGAYSDESYVGLLAQIRTYMMRDWYNAGERFYQIVDMGTPEHPITITNYRQLVFTVIYPWLTYEDVPAMYVPSSYYGGANAGTKADVLSTYGG